MFLLRLLRIRLRRGLIQREPDRVAPIAPSDVATTPETEIQKSDEEIEQDDKQYLNQFGA